MYHFHHQNEKQNSIFLMKQIYPGILTWEMLNDICKHDTYVLVFIDNDAGRYGQW